MIGSNIKKVFIWLVICALGMQMIPVSIMGDTWVQTTQEDFEGGETWDTNVTLSPGNITLEPSPIDWIKAQGNPIIDMGPEGTWDDAGVNFPKVIDNGPGYQIWYTGNDGSQKYIGYAESDDGYTYLKYSKNPILVNGSAGTWDDDSVMGPAIIFNGSGYQMWYTGFDGSNLRIGYATSPDGINWTRYGSNPVLDIGPNPWDNSHVGYPSVIFNGSGYQMWYSGYTATNYNIGYASSPDGILWTKYSGNPVLIGDFGQWDEKDIANPTVYYNGSEYLMWYQGFDGPGNSDIYKIGLATSPDALTWTKSTFNPVLQPGDSGYWDDRNVFNPNVIFKDNKYRMFYAGEKNGELKLRIGSAESFDGINWTKKAKNPTLDIGQVGTWDSVEVYGPCIVKDGSEYKMWYTGADGTDVRLGYANSTDGEIWNRPNLGLISYGGNTNNNIVLDIGLPGEWDDDSLQGPTVIIDEDEPIFKYKMWYAAKGIILRIGYAYSSDGFSWIKYNDPITMVPPYEFSDPVLDLGSSGEWDDSHVLFPKVIKEDNEFIMWYGGDDGSANYKIGFATSLDGINWTKHPMNPILRPGPAGQWDEQYVIWPHILKEVNIYRMYYQSGGANYKIGYAESLDGINWTKLSDNPILNIGHDGTWDRLRVGHPFVLKDGYEYKMWFSGHDGSRWRIGFATGAYGSKFKKEPSNPVLNLGPLGSWDDYGIGAPSILYQNGTYKMWYVGTEGGPNTDKIGYATSSDGLVWSKYYQNPVLKPSPPETWDDTLVGYPSVIFNGAEYLMYYNAITFVGDPNGKIGIANSSDGINWIKYPLNPIIDLGPPGSWDDSSIHDCSVVYHDGLYRMWFTGSPSGGIDAAEIGYATSLDGYNWSKYPGNPVFNKGGGGAWDSSLVALPSVWYDGNEYHLWYTGRDAGGNFKFGYANSDDGINWTKNPDNPILSPGSGGSWDNLLILSPNVVKINNSFRMWYGGSDGSQDRIGHAISYDGVNWTKRAVNPVMDVGEPGSWDDNHVNMPSIHFDGSTYKMWYGGYDGTNYQIGYATSNDAENWVKESNNPVLSLGLSGEWDDYHVSDMDVLFNGTEYKMWYSGHDGTNYKIGYATSNDGINWVKHGGNPILSLGSSGSWEDEGVSSPSIFYDGFSYKMWYTGFDGANRRIGYATSSNGINWTKYAGNPVINLGSSGAWDETDSYHPNVIFEDGLYKLWYAGDDGVNWGMGFATSYDGINWIKSKINPILKSGPVGTWNDDRIYCPTIIKNGTAYRMIFSGYDGTIVRMGIATSDYTSTGTFESSIYDSGNSGTFWNSISWNETLPPNTLITLSVRTGNTPQPDSTWTNWTEEIYDSFGSIISQPRSRYLQYRATLISLDAKHTPILEDVTVNYDLNEASAPILVSPSNDLWTTNNIPTFTWNFSDPNFDFQLQYNLEIDEDPMFGGVVNMSVYVFTSLEEWISVFIIPDGTWYWRVRTMDHYELWSDWSENRSVNIDTTPPASPTPVIAQPDTWTNVNSFTVNWTDPSDFSGVKPGAWYKIGSPPTSNSDGTWQAANPITATSLESQQTIYIWLEDNLGNVDFQNNATTVLYLDTTPPSTPINLGAVPDSWTGSNSFSINWTNPADDSGVKVGAWYKIGSPPTSNSDGTWTDVRPFTVTSSEGQQLIYVWLEDNVGNVDYLNNATVSLYLDTTPPNAFTPTADPSGWTSNDQPTITFLTTDSASGISHYEVQVDTGSFFTQTSSYTIPSQTDGTHTVTVRAYDNVGNYRDGTVDIYIDTTAPEAFTPAADPSGWTTNDQPQITFSTTDATSGVSHYEVGIDGGSFTIQTSPYTLPSLSDGTHTITVRAYDNAGNYREGTVEIYIDTTCPSVPSEVEATPDSWTQTNSFVIEWTNPTETDTSGIKVGTWFKIGSPPTLNSDGTWIGDKPITVTSLEGEQVIYIWLEDNIGNVDYNNYGTTTLYLDTTPPGPPTNVTASPGSWAFVNSFNIDWINPSDDSGIKTGVWYKIGAPPTSDSDGTWVADKPITVAGSQGENTIYIWLEDNLGNKNHLNFGSTLFYLDSMAPNITHTPVTHAKKGEAITISATVIDNIGVKNVTLHYKKQGDESFESIPMSKEGDVYSADIPSSFVTEKKIEYYISASDEINTATYPSSGATTDYLPIDVEDEDVLFLPSWLWLLLVLFIILALMILFMSLRRSDEGGEVGVSEEEQEIGAEESESPVEESAVIGTEEEGGLGDLEEEPQPQEQPSPEEESELVKGKELTGTPLPPKPGQIPPPPAQDIADDEIFNMIKAKFQEGKISEKTFEDFKKRYNKE